LRGVAFWKVSHSGGSEIPKSKWFVIPIELFFVVGNSDKGIPDEMECLDVSDVAFQMHLWPRHFLIKIRKLSSISKGLAESEI
jgi:hypothetical protein